MTAGLPREMYQPDTSTSSLKAPAKEVQSAGRYGDDILVHVNRQEFEQMKSLFGPMAMNPHTGLPEFGWLGNLLKAAAPALAFIPGFGPVATALLAAGIGGTTAALSGDNVVKGAIRGGFMGATPGISTALGVGGNIAGSALVGAGTGAASAALTGGDVGLGALGGGIGGGLGSALDGGSLFGGAVDGAGATGAAAGAPAAGGIDLSGITESIPVTASRAVGPSLGGALSGVGTATGNLGPQPGATTPTEPPGTGLYPDFATGANTTGSIGAGLYPSFATGGPTSGAIGTGAGTAGAPMETINVTGTAPGTGVTLGPGAGAIDTGAGAMPVAPPAPASGATPPALNNAAPTEQIDITAPRLNSGALPFSSISSPIPSMAGIPLATMGGGGADAGLEDDEEKKGLMAWIKGHPSVVLGGGLLAGQALLGGKAGSATPSAGAPPPGTVNNLNNTANNLNNQGTALQSYLTSGQLPPGAMAAVNNASRAAKATLRSRFAAMGMTGSTSEATALAGVEQHAAEQIYGIAKDLYDTGMKASGMSADIYRALLGYSQNEDNRSDREGARLDSAISNFAAALAGRI